MRISWVCVSLFVYTDFDQTPVIQSLFLWSLPARSQIYDLSESCEVAGGYADIWS